MRLAKARFNSFRSLVEAELVVDPRVTVLVGANECGKTNVLRALEASTGERSLEDAVCQFSPAYEQGLSPQVQLLFCDFSPEEREAICAAYTEAAQYAHSKAANSQVQAGAEHDNEGRKIVDLTLDPPPSVLPEILGTFTKLSVTRQGDLLEDCYFHFDEKEVDFSDTAQDLQFRQLVWNTLPTFLYFDDISILHGQVRLEEVLGNDSAFDTERNLLRLGGMLDLGVLKAHAQRRDVAIKNAQDRITERLRKYWTQDPSRQFYIDVDGDVLRIRLSDSTGVYDFPEDRSLGSRWFVSFYVNFVSRIEQHQDNVILLLDEPGIHVHPRGQRDLLPIFEEIGGRHQLIYSTHLPFLINRNFPGRIRVVEKAGALGTRILNKPHQNRWKAIRSAVGLLAADSFLIGDTCLVVEGVSDHLYLAGLFQMLADLQCPSVDLNWAAIIPGGSAAETVAPARFCQAENVPVVVLLDSDNQGQQARTSLLKDGFLQPHQVVHVGDVVSGITTIEDLLPLDLWLDAVNIRYVEISREFKTVTAEEFLDARKRGPELPSANVVDSLLRERGFKGLDKRAVAETFVNRLPIGACLGGHEREEWKQRLRQFGQLAQLLVARLRATANMEERSDKEPNAVQSVPPSAERAVSGR